MKTLSVREKSKKREKFSFTCLPCIRQKATCARCRDSPPRGCSRPGKGCCCWMQDVQRQSSASTTLTELAEKSVSPRTISVILATSAPDSSPLSVETTTLTLLSPIKATHSG